MNNYVVKIEDEYVSARPCDRGYTSDRRYAKVYESQHGAQVAAGIHARKAKFKKLKTVTCQIIELTDH